MVREETIEGKPVRFLEVPPDITKTAHYSVVVITNRLWEEIKLTSTRNGHIFKNRLGRPWTNYKRKKMNLEKYFGENRGWIRDCRRGGITYNAQVRQLPRDIIKAQSGHKTDSVFQRYNIVQINNIARMMEE